MKYYIKLITGFRKDQHITIPMQEAHKAYYLFKNPEERGVFENGVAIIGRNIQEILPDYHTTMGWNSTHDIDSDDWNQLNENGVAKNMKFLIEKAKDAGDLMLENPEIGKLKLIEIMKDLPQIESPKWNDDIKTLSEKFKIN